MTNTIPTTGPGKESARSRPSLSPNKDTYAVAIGAAVRAEMSRKGKPVASLASVLSLSKTSVYSRTQGREPFDYVELQKIADHLEIPLMQLVEAAAS